jgi:signal recognition particle subunit SRP19
VENREVAMKKMVIWPASLAAGKTKREGRLVARKHAVKSPKVEEIEKVAKKLNLEPEVERAKAYPRSPWERGGRVLVLKRGRKGELLRQIADGIRVSRESSRSGGK